MYNFEETYKATLDYFKGNELAANVWMSKYALKDTEGNFLELTPDDMHRRLAREFARIEANYPTKNHPDMSGYGRQRKPLTENDIFELFKEFKNIIPQGSVMAVLGDSNFTGSLSNCTVIPSPYDSYGGIMYTDQQLTALMKRRCGVGFDISTLRPATSPVSNTAKTSTGAVSFMHRFSNTTREVAQSGRRGALMVTMDCRHPDILEFITVKQDLTKVTGANISVMWTDDFMAAVESDSEYTLRWPVTSPVNEAQFTKVVNAKDVWDAAVTAAHTSAEPGMIFIDTMRKYSTCDAYDPILSTNPCSEIGMGNDSCRLIAINMFGAVNNPFVFNIPLENPDDDAWPAKNFANFDFARWYKTCYEATRLSDDLVDLELEHVNRILAKIDQDPEPEHIKIVERQTWEQLRDSAVAGRRIGLGFTALGDTLAALGLKYDSPEAKAVIENIMITKMQAEWDATTDMAIERGAMPLWEQGFKSSKFFENQLKNYTTAFDRMLKHGRRNISISTVAPTGSLSLLAKLIDRHGTTSGIEPLFASWYIRRKKVNANEAGVKVDFIDDTGDAWTNFKVFHEGLKEWATQNNIDDIEAAYDQSPYYQACAPDIDWQTRVEIQGLIQQYVTHSISSTVNLPATASVEDVSTIYREAYKNNLKGITVYRDGSRSGVLITEEKPKIAKNDAPKRPKRLPCIVYNTSVRGEYWVVLIGLMDGEPYELFAYPNGRVSYKEGAIVKLGGGKYNLEVDGKIIQEDIASLCVNDEQAALTRLISAALRHGTDVVFVVEQLEKAGGTIVDFSKAVARALKKGLAMETRMGDEVCPECGDTLVREDGCTVCKSCGIYSKCD